MSSVQSSVKLFGIMALVAMGVSASCGRANDTTAEASAVLERTKTTQSTYTLRLSNRVTKPGEPQFEEESAEFHQGDLHRVETPRDRLIANCRTGSGNYLSVATGEMIEGPKVAAAACGINTNFPIISIKLLGDIGTKFGPAKQVRITDKDNIREYTVAESGALLRTTYRENRPDGALLIVSEAKSLELSVPDPSMFTKESLSRSYLLSDRESN